MRYSDNSITISETALYTSVVSCRSLAVTLLLATLWGQGQAQSRQRMSSSDSGAKRLYDDRLKRSGYNKLIRPVGNTSDALTVRIGLRLTQIIDVVSRPSVDLGMEGGRGKGKGCWLRGMGRDNKRRSTCLVHRGDNGIMSAPCATLR